MYYLKVFLGYLPDPRKPEGAFSWQHILFVSSLLIAMVILAVLLGKKYKNTDLKTKNKVIIASAIAIDAFEIFKLIVYYTRSDDPISTITHNLPLFLCSIQLIAIPLAAFAKGKVKAAALDFVMIFGILGAVMGPIGAIQDYNAYAVISLENVVSGITHTISGFTALYIISSGMASMKLRNIPNTCLILLVFCDLASIANYLFDYNYMFLVNHDGTPYQLIYNLVDGDPIIYPLTVIALFFVYMAAYYATFYLVVYLSSKKSEARQNALAKYIA